MAILTATSDEIQTMVRLIPASCLLGLVLAAHPVCGAQAGDFDGNGMLEAADIDLLSDAVQLANTDRRFDVNQDGRVDNDDRIFWVKSLKHSFFGDANFDLQFNTADLVLVFQAGEFEDDQIGNPISIQNSTWVSGDWSGDREFGTADLVAAFQDGGFEQGSQSTPLASVPEPAGICLLALGVAGILSRIRQQ